MASPPRNAVIRSASLGLALLSFINLFNYLDRYVVAALVESLKHSEFALTDAQLGSLMSGFLIVFTMAAPVFGLLGDRGSRPRLIAFAVGCWSAATFLSGLAGSFTALLGARAAVGIGEAAYVTIAPGLLADYFPRRQLGRVMAIFFCAIPVGSALGFVVGGLVDVHFGWRMAFFVAGVPGAVLAVLCLGLEDPPRGIQDAHEGPEALAETAASARRTASTAAAVAAAYRELLRRRPYVLTILGYAAYTFALGGLAFWMPAYLERVRGMPRAQATVTFGTIVVVTGFVGTFLGGWLGDHCVRYSRQAHLWISAAATLIAAPFTWIALTTGSSFTYTACMVMAQLMMFLSTGPINASIVNLVSPARRASATALSVLTIHLLGDVPSPWIIGKLSDLSSLTQAVKIVPLAILVSAAVWCLAARAQAREAA